MLGARDGDSSVPVVRGGQIAVVVSTRELPSLHKDPFDRMLLAQALVEGVVVATHDTRLARYGPPVRRP
jgi:PIN domain nuclease of toxin-antitoxin system